MIEHTTAWKLCCPNLTVHHVNVSLQTTQACMCMQILAEHALPAARAVELLQGTAWHLSCMSKLPQGPDDIPCGHCHSKFHLYLDVRCTVSIS